MADTNIPNGKNHWTGLKKVYNWGKEQLEDAIEEVQRTVYEGLEGGPLGPVGANTAAAVKGLKKSKKDVEEGTGKWDIE